MNIKPEHCFSISDPADVKYYFNSVYDRIYFGNEFCEFLLPDRNQVKNMLGFAARVKVPFTLMTPACTGTALSRVRRLLEDLPPDTEVVFNDWGVLEAVLDARMIPVHGRLLCHAKKDPRLAQGHAGMPHARVHNIQGAYQTMLLAADVRRVELDNVLQGLDLQPHPHMRFSLHYPFVPCTVTRKCYFANKAAGYAKFRTISDCGVCCRGENIPVHTTGATLYMKGNTQYYTNSEISVSSEPPCIDRYVFTPVFPNHNFTETNALYLDWNRLFENSGAPAPWGDEPDATLAALVGRTRLAGGGAALNVLDLGCGTGRHAALFGNNHYVGMDISSRAVETARNSRKGEFVQGDILDSDACAGYRGFFHTVVDYGCFHAIAPRHRRRYFENVHTLMAPGGLLLLCAWASADDAAPVFFVNEQLPEWGASPDALLRESRGLFDLSSHHTVPCTDRSMIYAILKKL